MTTAPPTAATPPPGAPGSGPQPVGTPPAPSRRQDLLHRMLHGTPGRMRLLAAASVLAALVIGAVSANALLASRAAAERAAVNTAQVIRIQSLHVDLLRADALATNAFLGGGLESPDRRSRYDAAIADATTGVAAAAAAQPADARALGALADEIRSYTSLVEQARANNRLGLPVGAQYLRQASAGLRSDAIPILETITTANTGRSEAEFARADSTLQLLVGVLGILVLLGVALWLARRTHRYLNGPLLAAAVVLVAALAGAGIVIGGTAGQTTNVARGDYSVAVSLADVSTAANDARANESLTLIARGSGGAFEEAWRADDALVRDRLGRPGVQTASGAPLTGQWEQYANAHTEVRSLDDGGSWDEAVALATSTEDTGAGALFAVFDQQVSEVRDRASDAAVDRLSTAGNLSPYVAVLVALAALAACWLVVRGFARRIEEYK